MDEAMMMAAAAGLGLVALGIVLAAALKGWQGWLDLKRHELAAATPREPRPAMERIELADLKERVRKLESIAACVDL